jgi:hypothetical protein
MCVPLVHHFHTESGTGQDVGPSVDYMALAILNRLVKVETIPRFLHPFLSEWGGLYLHLYEVSGADPVLRNTLVAPSSL